MFLVRWAAIALLTLEAAAAALYSLLLASVAAAYWQSELASRQSTPQPHLSWLDVFTQTVLLVAVVVIYVVVPAAIALGAARRRSWWLWAGVAYELGWALLLTPVIVGLDPDLNKVGLIGAALFAAAALMQGRRAKPRHSRRA